MAHCRGVQLCALYDLAPLLGGLLGRGSSVFQAALAVYFALVTRSFWLKLALLGWTLRARKFVKLMARWTSCVVSTLSPSSLLLRELKRGIDECAFSLKIFGVTSKRIACRHRVAKDTDGCYMHLMH